MCELLGISSNLPATVDLSLNRFAQHGGRTGRHHDGWGIAYFEGRDVRLIKEAEAAADSAWIRFLNAHSLRSPLVVAHVRHATVGVRSYANTQPFLRELGGHAQVFAHNGDLPALADTPYSSTHRFQAIGETDSERAFCLLLDRLAGCWQDAAEIPTLERRLDAVAGFATILREYGPANFLYADGDVLFAHGDRRFNTATRRTSAPGLVTLGRWCRGDERGFVTDGLVVGGTAQMITLIASVPLTDEAWEPLSEGEVIAVTAGRIVARRPVA
ncbi:MAG: class II glutamine amidotransferase [Gammaproteobacteria bacterium]